jgi:hypothetical protein
MVNVIGRQEVVLNQIVPIERPNISPMAKGSVPVFAAEPLQFQRFNQGRRQVMLLAERLSSSAVMDGSSRPSFCKVVAAPVVFLCRHFQCRLRRARRRVHAGGAAGKGALLIQALDLAFWLPYFANESLI